jgi:hypothetical protein
MNQMSCEQGAWGSQARQTRGWPGAGMTVSPAEVADPPHRNSGAGSGVERQAVLRLLLHFRTRIEHREITRLVP